LFRSRGDCSASSHRFQATPIPAVTQSVMSDVNMSYFSGRFCRAAVRLAVAYNAGANAIANLDENHVI
jgi:hypothetical protein